MVKLEIRGKNHADTNWIINLDTPASEMLVIGLVVPHDKAVTLLSLDKTIIHYILNLNIHFI